jgi:hypothetical protein
MIQIAKYLLLAFVVFTLSTVSAFAMRDASTSPPLLQGMTAQHDASAFQKVSPSASDQRIQGVNTSGTVRVNNLANLESLLNIGANTSELVLIGLGIYYIYYAFFPISNTPTKAEGDTAKGPGKAKAKIVIQGIILINMGLMVPGIINWLVASSRDAALCGGVF